MTLALWPSLRSLGFRWHLRFDWNHPAVRRLGKLALWVVVYVVANQLAYVVIIVFTGKFAGRLPDLRERVHPLPAPARDRGGLDLHRAPAADVEPVGGPRHRTGCARCSPAASATPSSSSCRPRSGTSRSRSRSSACSCSTVAPNADDAENIARTLQAFAVGLPFFSAFQLLTRTFYAMQDTRTPALVNVAAAVVNIARELPVPVVRLGVARPRARPRHVVCVRDGRVPGAAPDADWAGSTGDRIVVDAGAGDPGRRCWPRCAAFLASRAVSSDVVGSGTGTLSRLAEVSVGVVVGVLVFAISALIVRIDEADEVKDAVLRRFRR